MSPKRDADLIAHLSRLRDGALSDEARRLMRAGLGVGGAMAPPAPAVQPVPVEQPAPATGATRPPVPKGEDAYLSEIERAITDSAWD